jgi:hypothetical protein
MKCVDMTREAAERSVGSEVVAAAILVMEMEEVFVARIAWGGQILASWAKMSAFSLGISGTASMTKSTSDRESKVVEGLRRERTEAAVSSEIFDLATSFARSLSLEGELLA